MCSTDSVGIADDGVTGEKVAEEWSLVEIWWEGPGERCWVDLVQKLAHCRRPLVEKEVRTGLFLRST